MAGEMVIMVSKSTILVKTEISQLLLGIGIVIKLCADFHAYQTKKINRLIL